MKKIDRILYVDEEHVNDNSALHQAIDLAKSHQAKLTVVGCFESLNKLSDNYPSTQLLIDDMVKQKRLGLYQSVKSISNDLQIEVKVFTDKPYLDIIIEAMKFDADIVIKPVEPSGFKTMLFGGKDLKLLRMCPCPLWLIKSSEQQGNKQIVVAIDHEPDNPENQWVNKQLLDYGVLLAGSDSAEMHVVHCMQPKNETLMHRVGLQSSETNIDEIQKNTKQQRYDWLKQTVDDCLSSHGETTQENLPPILHLLDGPAAFKIPELVEELEPELLIMGTVGRTGIPGFLIGNTAEAVLFNINCSLLAVKPKGFVSPVKSNVH